MEAENQVMTETETEAGQTLDDLAETVEEMEIMLSSTTSSSEVVLSDSSVNALGQVIYDSFLPLLLVLVVGVGFIGGCLIAHASNWFKW